MIVRTTIEVRQEASNGEVLVEVEVEVEVGLSRHPFLCDSCCNGNPGRSTLAPICNDHNTKACC